jgi:hypothetical protein
MTRLIQEELEARVGIEPTYKGFADPLIVLLSFSESTHATLESELCPLFVHLPGELSINFDVRTTRTTAFWHWAASRGGESSGSGSRTLLRQSQVVPKQFYGSIQNEHACL